MLEPTNINPMVTYLPTYLREVWIKSYTDIRYVYIYRSRCIELYTEHWLDVMKRSQNYCKFMLKNNCRSLFSESAQQLLKISGECSLYTPQLWVSRELLAFFLSFFCTLYNIQAKHEIDQFGWTSIILECFLPSNQGGSSLSDSPSSFWVVVVVRGDESSYKPVHLLQLQQWDLQYTPIFPHNSLKQQQVLWTLLDSLKHQRLTCHKKEEKVPFKSLIQGFLKF